MLSPDNSFTDNSTDNQIPDNFIHQINKVPVPCFSHLLKTGTVKARLFIFSCEIFPFLCHCGNTTVLPLLQLPMSTDLAELLAESLGVSHFLFLDYGYKIHAFILIHNLKHSFRLTPSPVLSNIIFYKFVSYNIATYFHS